MQFICEQKAQSGIDGTFQLSSVQLRFFLVSWDLFGPVSNQFDTSYFCCSCCCLRLSSRIRLWVGSSTPASSRSSSVMSLGDNIRETPLKPPIMLLTVTCISVGVYLRNSRSSQPLCRRPCSYLSSPSLCSHSPTDSPTDKDELLLPHGAYASGIKSSSTDKKILILIIIIIKYW